MVLERLTLRYNSQAGSIKHKEGEALRCKIGPTFYQKIMLDIE
jgi:hypothetical protein